MDAERKDTAHSDGPPPDVLQIDGPVLDSRNPDDYPEDAREQLERAALMGILAAGGFSDRDQTLAVRQLSREAFAFPFVPERRKKMEAQGFDPDPEALRDDARSYIAERLRTWASRGGRHASYHDLRYMVKDYLNDELAKLVMGPDARKLWRSDEGDAPERLADIRTSRDDEEDGPRFDRRLLDRLYNEEESERLRMNLELLRPELGEDARRLLAAMEAVTGANVTGAAEQLGWTRYRARKAWGEIREAASGV